MKKLTQCMALVLFLTLCSCTDVPSTVPVGEEVFSIEADDWEGVWAEVVEDEVYFVQVVEPENGILNVQWFDDGELRSVELSLRRSGRWIFGNIPMSDVARAFGDDDALEAEGYSWFRILRDEDTILWWLPEEDRFEELIANGTLPGAIEDGAAFLGPMNAEQLEIITSGSHGVLMEWDEPAVLGRVAGRR